MSTSHPHRVPQSYPLMQRTWLYAPWRSVVGVVLLLLGAIIIAPLLMVPVLVVALLADGQRPLGDALSSALTLDSVTWPAMLYLNLTLAAMIPLTWLISRYLHRLRPRWLTSVQPGIRWRFFWACFGLAVVAIIAQMVVAVFLPLDATDLGGDHTDLATRQIIGIAIVVLLTTPLQAIGEEYAFRGYLMQAVGSLASTVGEKLRLSVLGSRRFGEVAAIVATAGLFALAHGAQNAPLFLDRFLFGVMAGIVVVRTGGLEAGIALHIWNNLIAFGLALATGAMGDALTASEVSWWNLVLTVTMNGTFLVLVLVVARSMGISRMTTPHTAPPPPPPPPPPPGFPPAPPVLLPGTPRV